jgi:hypothetical protein
MVKPVDYAVGWLRSVFIEPGATMHHTQIVEDINTAVHHALVGRLYELDEMDLISRSDASLMNLPIVGGTQPTTALLLRRYHTQLHSELCLGHQPRIRVETLEDELRELTRAVVVTMGGAEGMSVDAAALIALVMQKRGLAKFCTLPSTSTTMH